MNNLDRHHGNIMVNTFPEPTGYHSPLAIDHERNMQYSKILRDGPRAKWMKNADPEIARIKRNSDGLRSQVIIEYAGIRQYVVDSRSAR